MSVNRVPAARPHPAETIPDRPPHPPAEPVVAAAVPEHAPPAARPERLSENFSVRVRPSTKAALGPAVDRLRVATGDRSISIASVTDEALREFLKARGLLP